MNEWHDLASPPSTAIINGVTTTIQFSPLAAYRGQIYRVSGTYFNWDTEEGEAHPDHNVLCYDPATDSWRSVSQVNADRIYWTTFVHNDTFYVIGNTIPGEEYGNYIPPMIERYDADDQTFSVVS